MPTPTPFKTILAWYEALPETPNHATPSDLTTTQWFLDQGFKFQHILSAFLLGSARRIRRDPDLPPLPPIKSLNYFIPIIREVQTAGGHDPGYDTYLCNVLFGTLPLPNLTSPDRLPQPPSPQPKTGALK